MQDVFHMPICSILGALFHYTLQGFSKIVLYFASLETYIIKENHAYLFRFMYLPYLHTNSLSILEVWKINCHEFLEGFYRRFEFQ
jgi:hypothetical protein